VKTATVRELRNEFGRISKWLERGESVEIVKRGKAFARIEPARRRKTFVGACPVPSRLPKDLDEPVNARWDAAQ
jgi:antitoxin (DNA-binding transcriptional repressor) of toxin-antitoxin stability system